MKDSIEWIAAVEIHSQKYTRNNGDFSGIIKKRIAARHEIVMQSNNSLCVEIVEKSEISTKYTGSRKFKFLELCEYL